MTHIPAVVSSSSTPRLSIVVATLNAARTFARCLASLENQEFSDWELLIADGASTDGTLSLIKQHSGMIRWWESRKDDGIYDAWNQAVRRAKGEYICFLGADDAWSDSGALSRIFDAISGEKYDLVSSLGVVCASAGDRQRIFGSAWDYGRIGRRSVVCHPGLLHHRELFDRYGLFDTRYRITGDLDFLLRLPQELRTLHVDSVSVCVDANGVSRKSVLARLREQRLALSHCPRYGLAWAYIAWLDKLWRYPIARVLRIPH